MGGFLGLLDGYEYLEYYEVVLNIQTRTRKGASGWAPFSNRHLKNLIDVGNGDTNSKKRIKNADNDAYYNIQTSLITSLTSRIDESRWPAFFILPKINRT